MNREIKFRGKRINNGEWIYGDLIGDRINGRYAILPQDSGFYKGTEWETTPETVGQYTGFKDKNKKEMYEGDIVKYKISSGSLEEGEYTESLRPVTYIDGRFDPVPSSVDCEDLWYSYSMYDFEVIGNIYENPEPQEGETK